jgi:sec-independent protein translocase protein TatA
MGDFLAPTHLLILLVIALLVFGPRRLPELGAGLGKSIRAFREAANGAKEAFTVEAQATSEPPPGAPSEGTGPEGR